MIIFFILSFVFIVILASPGILINYEIINIEIPFLSFIILGSWLPNLVAFFVIAFVIKQKGNFVFLCPN